MCGIAGWVDERPILGSLLVKMTGRLAHRGPDGDGIAIFDQGRAGFGHRRLAILDPGENGAQPVERDGHYLVHNGEIYNFRDLRKADQDLSGEYRSDGDAEVLLRQIMRKGPGALSDLEGMFAFAYFDPRDRSLLLARDRLGVKPLYYFEKNGTLLFASEPKALLEHFETAAEPDPEAMGDFLSYGYVPEDRCIFRGMRKLPPGCALLRRAGTTRVFRYWEPARVTVGREPAEQLGELLERAVRSHTVSDVPVGAFLSGGLDSSAVTAVLQRAAGGPVPTFTVAYGDGGLEDLTYARIAAASFGTRHTEEELVLGELENELGEMAETFDEPITDSTALAVFRLSRLARSRVKVVLSGDGGDEAFGGYGWHESSLAYEALRRRVSPLHPLFSWIDRAVLPILGNRSWGARSSGLKKIVSPDPVERYFSLRAFFTGEERRSMFRRDLGSDDSAWLFRRFTRADLAPAARLCYLDLKTYLPDNNLALVDRASMAHGLEVRVPLLDRSVVEFALSLTDEQLVRPGSTKILFRKSIAPWLPRPILERPKYGFSPPFKRWVRAEGGEKALCRLRNGILAREGIVDVAAVERRIAAGMPRRWNKLWLLLVLESWYRRWVAGRDGLRYQPSPATARPTAAITTPATASA
jgi:asparagine synthase (glutamine-hydrolysing)